MAKKIVGIDIGNRMLKLALVMDGSVTQSIVVDLPDNLVREGRVVSPDIMASLIKNSLKENGIRVRKAALVLEGENVYSKLVTVPLMTEAQLAYNLPFEFSDYISEELNTYCFDYMVLGTRESADENTEDSGKTVQVMDLLAVAAPGALIDDYKDLLKKAGLKLVKAAPVICALSALIRCSHAAEDDEELAFVDIGQESTRLHVFKGDAFLVSRELSTGLSLVENALAEYYNKDVHVAHTYLLTNFEDCQNTQVCRDAFSGIATELQRALNFYRFSNPDSNLRKMVLIGGGSAIPSLWTEIRGSLDIDVFPEFSDYLKGTCEKAYLFPGAYGITLD